MTALSKKMPEHEPSEIELLLPWHAAGTLNARDSRRVEQALARDPDLARQYAVIREEYAETIALNESRGAPSARAMQKLFAAIDAEPERRPSMARGVSAQISNFFAQLSPRALAWSAGVAALLVVLQAGVIGSVLIGDRGTSYKTASLSMNESGTRDIDGAAPPRALVRFAPDTNVTEITALLGKYQATVIGSVRDGMFRLQFGDQAMSKNDVTSLIDRLSHEKIVNLAVPAQ